MQEAIEGKWATADGEVAFVFYPDGTGTEPAIGGFTYVLKYEKAAFDSAFKTDGWVVLITYSTSTVKFTRTLQLTLSKDTNTLTTVDTGGDTGTYTRRATAVGDIIQFGGSNWRILDLQEGKALLITEFTLEARKYHGADGDITWADCELRAYLNGEFYRSFAESDRSRILEVVNLNPDNPRSGVPGGEPTSDRIFLLSLDDLEQYFKDDADRASDHWWMLRTPGYKTDTVLIVGMGGDLINTANGVYVNYPQPYRAALWLSSK
jgi:hypothetical protein